MKDLQGKVAVITGGGSGIGLAVALQLVKEGTDKIVIASTNKEKLEQAAVEVRQAGAQAFPVVCDVSDRSSVENLFDKTMKAYGTVDVLVCNAGVTTGGPYLNHKKEDWDWVYGVCLHGTVHCIQLFYPVLAKKGSGHIVITGSQAGMDPTWVSLHGPYTSAKAAVMTLGVTLRPEAAEHGVGVTNVIVAGVATEIMKCERSRPAKYGESQVLNLAKREARRIPTEEAALMIVDGIKQDKLWVATHPERKEGLKAYFDGILAAYDF